VDALSEFGRTFANDAHANEGGDREADTRGVDLGTVGADDSFILHAANTFGDGGVERPTRRPSFAKEMRASVWSSWRSFQPRESRSFSRSDWTTLPPSEKNLKIIKRN